MCTCIQVSRIYTHTHTHTSVAILAQVGTPGFESTAPLDQTLGSVAPLSGLHLRAVWIKHLRAPRVANLFGSLALSCRWPVSQGLYSFASSRPSSNLGPPPFGNLGSETCPDSVAFASSACWCERSRRCHGPQLGSRFVLPMAFLLAQQLPTKAAAAPKVDGRPGILLQLHPHWIPSSRLL